MDVLGITDWHVLVRQPTEVIERRMELLEMRGAFQANQRNRVTSSETASRPPADIEPAM